jgi:hypothetical protein
MMQQVTYKTWDFVNIWAIKNGISYPYFLWQIPPYEWTGFFKPVDNLPTFNQVKAGSAIPVKFSLNGNMGLNIFAPGYPLSQKIACDSAAPLDAGEQTVPAGGSGLTFDSSANQYIYVWKTDKSWTGCRQLAVKLNDGTTHYANFKFTK